MRGTSRASLAAAEERVEPLLGSADGIALAEELFAVARLLDLSAGLRRALSDPSREGDAKADLARRLLADKVSEQTVDVVSGLVRSRWSEGRDVADAAEHLGVQAALAAAERDGDLTSVEDELFRFGRLVEGDRELAAALSDRGASAERRTELVERLLQDRARPATVALARQAVAYPRGRSLADALEAFEKAAARRQQRLVARVTAAVPLTEQQRERLAAALRRVYDHDVLLNVDVDPDVVGGLRVQVGDEVIDATVVSRLDDARRRLAG
ncbi:MAG: F0F1 ATP synthase subunit delta [Actinomycetes bacterium]